jgi:hypothetical protein
MTKIMGLRDLYELVNCSGSYRVKVSREAGRNWQRDRSHVRVEISKM